MKRIRLYTTAALLAGSLAATGCVHQGALVDVPATLMRYQHKPTEARLLTLARSYAESINRNLRQQSPCPGQYADYGVALARLGCTRQANTMFNNEKFLFPNSTLYVDILKQTLTPAYAAEGGIDTSLIDIHTLDTITVRYTPEEEALLRQLEEDPAYKQMLKERAKAERERQAELKRKEKAAADQARKEARKAEQAALKAQREAEREARKAQREAQKKNDDNSGKEVQQ